MAAEGELPPEPAEAYPLPDEDFHAREASFGEMFAECSDMDAKKMSKEWKKSQYPEGDCPFNFTYAEVDLKTIHRVLNDAKRLYGPFYVGEGHFVDFGSGVGKAVLGAGLLHSFKQVVGIEAVEPLHNAAKAAEGEFKKKLEELSADAEKQGTFTSEVVLLNGDFVNEIEGSLKEFAPTCKMAFAVATCFLEPQLNALAQFGALMPEGSLFVTFGQQFKDTTEEWVCVSAEKYDMAWGGTPGQTQSHTVFVFKKQSPMVLSDDEDYPPPVA